MSTRYLSIVAVGSILDVGVDGNDRQMFSINFEIEADGWADTLLGEISTRLIDQGACAALGTDIFWGSDADIPSGAGPFVHLLRTGGLAPRSAHGPTSNHERPGLQASIRAADYLDAEARAQAVRDALHDLYNVTLAA